MSGYFLYHSIGTYPGKAAAMAQALDEFSAVWSAEDDGQWPAALGLRQRFIDLWSDLIDAPTGTLTTAENVTTALYSLIGGLPEGTLRGKRVLVAADCFPSLHFLLAGLQERFGFTLETVPLRPGEGWVRDEDMLERWDGTVALALLTLVSSTTSHRVDAARLAAHGSAQGSLVVVDITQGVGIVPFSLRDIAADAVVSTSLKWLCGASGAGILQVRRDLIETCRPELRGWFSQENPFSWDLDRFTYAGDIRRFDHGTPSVLAAVASLPGLEWVTARGVPAMAAENRVHAHALLAGADALGWQLLSPREDEARGGSVMLQVPELLVPAEVVAALRAQALFCDARGRTLRLSPGAVTTPEAIDALLSALRGLH